MLRNKIKSLRILVNWVCSTALDIFPNGSLNLVFKNTRITVKRAMVQEDLHTISVHAKSYDTLYRNVNLEGITNVTPLGVITHNKNCWISNNNTLDLPCTPSAQGKRQQPFKFNLTITISLI